MPRYEIMVAAEAEVMLRYEVEAEDEIEALEIAQSGVPHPEIVEYYSTSEDGEYWHDAQVSEITEVEA